MVQKILFVSLIISLIFAGGSQIAAHLAEPEATVSVMSVPSNQNEQAGRAESFIDNSPAADQIKTSVQNSDLTGVPGIPEDAQGRFISDENSVWTSEEMAAVNLVVSNTIQALAEVGLDGEQLLQGYRFRRYQAEFVDQVQGQIALVYHHKMEVVLSDSAFLRHQGFNIYHELGHIVDEQLDRQLSQAYHAQAQVDQASGSPEAGQTADGYWLRPYGQADREEATADAFALWVQQGQTDARAPVFGGTPVTVDYGFIAGAIADALREVTS